MTDRGRTVPARAAPAQAVSARVLRGGLVAVVALLAVVAAVAGSRFAGPSDQVAALLPSAVLVAAAMATVGLLPWFDRFVARGNGYRELTPYSALAGDAGPLQAGSLEEALPALAQVLADGTGARSAAIWLSVGERLVPAAVHPPEPGSASTAAAERRDGADSLATLLARPETGHVVTVLEGPSLRAVLSIDKPELPITPADRALVRDVARGAGLLLRGVALNAELAERVDRADGLALELQASRQRLAQARDVERRRLLTELSRATGGRLARLQTLVAQAGSGLAVGAGDDVDAVRDALGAAGVELDDLLDGFRSIARGVYPAVLRGQGTGPALEEMAADLPRPVRLTGDLGARLGWEIEAGGYHAVAAVLNVLAGIPGPGEILVRITVAGGRFEALVEDPANLLPAAELRATLADDAERLAALGGAMEWSSGEGPWQLLVWLPDHLEPVTPDRLPGSS